MECLEYQLSNWPFSFTRKAKKTHALQIMHNVIDPLSGFPISDKHISPTTRQEISRTYVTYYLNQFKEPIMKEWEEHVLNILIKCQREMNIETNYNPTFKSLYIPFSCKRRVKKYIMKRFSPRLLSLCEERFWCIHNHGYTDQIGIVLILNLPLL